MSWTSVEKKIKIPKTTNIYGGTAIYLHHDLISRSTKQRCLNEGGNRTYEYRVKTAQEDEIPQVPSWSKHKQPYISSPTLLTGNEPDCGLDNCQKLSYRDRSLSVGSKEMQCPDIDLVSAAYATNGNRGCEYQTHVLWHVIWKQQRAYQLFVCWVHCRI